MAYVVFNLLAAAALIGIDQAIKLWATNVLQPVGAMPLIPHVVELQFVLNPGMAFSLLSGKQLFLIIATSIALILVAYGLFFRSRGRYPVSYTHLDVYKRQNSTFIITPYNVDIMGDLLDELENNGAFY